MERKFRAEYLFNEEDLLILFMFCLYEKNIDKINENEIVDKLYPYKYDENYKSLFENILSERYDSKLDLYEGICQIKADRIVKWWSDKPKDLFFKMNDWKNFVEQTYSPKYIDLMKKLVDEYILRTNIEIKNDNKVNIYGLNPNKNYSLTTGRYNGEYYGSRIITDGHLIKDEYVKHTSDTPILVNNIIKTNEYIGLLNAKSRHIEIENANFVINQMEQGCYDKAYLYTKIMELEQLEYLARLSKGALPEDAKLITNDKPYVYSLKPENK